MEKEIRDEVEREKKKIFDEGHAQGYTKAEEDVVDQLEKAEEIFRQQQHSESYVLGFNKALDDMGVAPDDARRATVEVPPLDNSEPPVEDQEEMPDAETNVDTAADAFAEAQNTGSTTTPITTPEA